MKEQELEYHVRQLEYVFNNATPAKREGMRPGIQTMIRLLKADNQRMPLSLRRIERKMEKELAVEFFDNMPV